jgi:hypothetical protein
MTRRARKLAGGGGRARAVACGLPLNECARARAAAPVSLRVPGLPLCDRIVASLACDRHAQGTLANCLSSWRHGQKIAESHTVLYNW